MSIPSLEQQQERKEKAAAAAIKYTHFFSTSDEKDEYTATLSCQQRHGVMWFTSLWVRGDYRHGGLGGRLLRMAVDQLGGYDCYLQVMAYSDQPLSDEQLTRWYGTFGFMPTDAPGVLCRKADPEKEA